MSSVGFSGIHPPAEVIEAWGSLITLMFSSMRDGYYERLRKERRASKKMSRQASAVLASTLRTSVESAEGQQTEENGPSLIDDFQQLAENKNQQNGKTTAVIISDFFNQ